MTPDSFTELSKRNYRNVSHQVFFMWKDGSVVTNDKENYCQLLTVLTDYFKVLLNCEESVKRFNSQNFSHKNMDSKQPSLDDIKHINKNQA